MRVCLVGHFVERPDDAVREIASSLHRALAERHEVVKVSISEPRSWGRAAEFRPDVLHFVLSPTLRGLLAARILSLRCPRAVRVLTVPHLSILRGKQLLGALKLDLALAHSEGSAALLKRHGWRVRLLPGGVDAGRFLPVGLDAKRLLRKKYGIDERKFVILHVGPVKRWRNISALLRLQGDGNQVLIVGRPSQKKEMETFRELEDGGCLVRQEYIERLEDIYNAADAYVFPTLNPLACVEVPLSVLEAMSCNLRVVATRFGGLPAMFAEGRGLAFAGDAADLGEKLQLVRQSADVDTRAKVVDYSWPNVASRIEDAYQELLQG